MLQLENHYTLHGHLDIVRLYGITKQLDTGAFMLVFRYYEQGDMHMLYNRKENNMSYKEICESLRDISRGISYIHDNGLYHHDLHSGNILLNNKFCYIADLGICKPANSTSNNKEIVGVLPYIAPEVLCGGLYTQAADIYSFGMLAWVLFARQQPFSNMNHSDILQRDICRGLRPYISKSIPEWLAELITCCWNADSTKRPSAKEIFEAMEEYYQIFDVQGSFDFEIDIPETQDHPSAVYYSRKFAPTVDVPIPFNSTPGQSYQSLKDTGKLGLFYSTTT